MQYSGVSHQSLQLCGFRVSLGDELVNLRRDWVLQRDGMIDWNFLVLDILHICWSHVGAETKTKVAYPWLSLGHECR